MLKTEAKCREIAALPSCCVRDFSTQVFPANLQQAPVVVPQRTFLTLNTIRPRPAASLELTGHSWAVRLLRSSHSPSSHSPCGHNPPYVCLCKAGCRMHSWRAERNISFKIIQPKPSLAPSIGSQRLIKQEESNGYNLKGSMKPSGGCYFKSLLRCASRKPGKDAERQVYCREAAPWVRTPIKAHPLNPLHLSLSIYKRSSSLIPQCARGHVRGVKVISS